MPPPVSSRITSLFSVALGGRWVTDLQDRACSLTDSRHFEHGAHGVGDAALLPDHPPHILFRDFEMEDDVIAGVLFRHLDCIRIFDDGLCHKLDQLFHGDHSVGWAASGSSVVRATSLAAAASACAASGSDSGSA